MNTGSALLSRIRQSVIQDRYPEATELLSQYLEGVASTVRRVGARDPAAEALRQEATQLLRWARRMACMGRDRDSARIVTIAWTRRYHAPPAVTTPSWMFDA